MTDLLQTIDKTETTPSKRFTKLMVQSFGFNPDRTAIFVSYIMQTDDGEIKADLKEFPLDNPDVEVIIKKIKKLVI